MTHYELYVDGEYFIVSVAMTQINYFKDFLIRHGINESRMEVKTIAY